MDELAANGFDVEYRSHARAILETDFPEALRELAAIIGDIRIPIVEIIASGGGEAKATQRLRNALTAIGWRKTTFTIEKIINGVRRESISHEIDHVRRFDNGTAIALEIEWNNKDPFFRS